MFTVACQKLIDRAKAAAARSGQGVLALPHLLESLRGCPESAAALAECLSIEPFSPAGTQDAPADGLPFAGTLRLEEPVHVLLERAQDWAETVPCPSHPGLIDTAHLVAGWASHGDACALLGCSSPQPAVVEKWLRNWLRIGPRSFWLSQGTERMRRLRGELLARVFGQDHAIHAFVEGLFNAEVVASADSLRKGPRAVFIFCGPPGVGKTLLAELGAAAMARPFRRFDMSAYFVQQQNEALVGMAPGYKGAQPGTLTGFVRENPTAVLLFDEIEKAHPSTIQLFLQILDAGRLDDKFHEQPVDFRETTLIFTTNVGRTLYDRPNASGVHRVKTFFHRKTILDALETEKDPATNQPYFPPALCSRLSAGYPVLFHRLGVSDMERVVRAEMTHVAGLLERQYFKRIVLGDLVPMCLVLREGARADARTLSALAGSFLKTELFNFCSLFEPARLDELMDSIDAIRFDLDGPLAALRDDVRTLFEGPSQPRVLLVGSADLAGLYRRHIPEIAWHWAGSADDALQVLADEEIDAVLLDLWMGQPPADADGAAETFDFVPAGSRGLDRGQEVLRKIRDRLPDTPVYLLSQVEGDEPEEGLVDEELFLACVRGGGARGVVVSGLVDERRGGGPAARDRLAQRLRSVTGEIYRQKAADRMGHQHMVLSFDTAPHVDSERREVTIRLRNFHLGRALAAADAGEVLDEVERPRIRFDDVIGAEAAKEELRFFVEYLRSPRRFAALGLKLPKGVLLHGPPGTGKTLLARAMAGESDVAFLSASASSFVTIWQGSGPQSIRDLFARARRYAPSIVFIDEIDAVGRVRTGSPGGAQASETTLNALLAEMDGFTSPAPHRPVFVLAATNFQVPPADASDDWSEMGSRTLDPALVRRFSRTILVDLPERPARSRYLTVRLAGRPGRDVSPQTIDLIAQRSAGMTLARLETVLETAARRAAHASVPLSDELLLEAFETVRFGETRKRDLRFMRRTSYHEAGHTILYWLSGWWPAYVTIVSRGEHGGYMAPAVEEVERRDARTLGDLLAAIRTALGGRAAEIVMYGPSDGLTTGAAGDLELATSLARQIVCRYGMDEEFGLLVTPELMKYEAALSSPVYLRVNEEARKTLREQMDQAVALLRGHHAELDRVAQTLIERERLTAAELQQLLPATAEPAR